MVKTLAILMLVLAFIGCGASSECRKPENMNSLKCTAVNGTIDCTKDVAPAVIMQVGTVFEKVVLENTSADGSVDWGHIWHVFGGMGSSYGMCLLAQMIDRYMAGPPPMPAGVIAPEVSQLRLGFAAGRQSYKLAPETAVKTAKAVHR